MRARAAWLLVSGVALGGCPETRVVPSTQIMVVVDADETVRARATTLAVLVRGGTGAGETMHEPRFSPPSWPVHVATVPRDGDVSRALRVEARAIDAVGPFVSDFAVTSFLPDRLLELRLFLEGSCVDHTCGTDETCEAGGCRSALVDPATLPDFVPGAPDRDAGAPASPALRALTLSAGSLTPAFDPEVTSYTATVPLLHHSLVVTAPPAASGAAVTVADLPVDASSRSRPVALPGVAPITHTVEVRVDAAGASRTYTVTVTRSSSMRELTSVVPSDPHAGDAFGWSIAHAPGTLVIGAPRWDDDATANAGAVYVFVERSGRPTQAQLIRSPNPEIDRHFGWSVAITADGTRLYVGDGRHSSGAIHKYVRAPDADQFTYVDSTTPLPGLGSSLAIDGSTLVAGADQSDLVQVFDLAAAGFTPTTLIDDSMSRMGIDTGIAGDLLVASGPLWMGERGAIYTSVRTGMSWSPVARQSGAVPADGFGWTVAVRGAWADRPAMLAAGSWATSAATGAVAVFERSGLEWIAVEAPPSPSEAGGQFGWRLALSGDVCVVGAPGSEGGRGSAYLFVRAPEGSSWTSSGRIQPADAMDGDQFGGSWSRGIVVSGDRLFITSAHAGPRVEENFPFGVAPVGAGRVYLYE